MPRYKCRVRQTYYKEVEVIVSAPNDLEAGDRAESEAEDLFPDVELHEDETMVMECRLLKKS